MNQQECAKVLAKIQLVDNRVVDALTLAEWFDTIGFLDYDDAIAAVRDHRRESTVYLTPAHVVAGARRVKAQRIRQERRSMSFAERQRIEDQAEMRRLGELGVL